MFKKREMLKMLEKDSIQKVVPKQGRFLSNIFLVVKNDGGNFPVINLKNLNKFIPPTRISKWKFCVV